MFQDNLSTLSSKVQSKSFFLECLALEDGPISCPEISVTTNLRCVTSQISEDLINVATKA